MEGNNDFNSERDTLTRKMEAGIDIVLQTDRAAVMRNVFNPKAQFHFVVLPKENIANVTDLTPEHLPLLDHMLELAHEVIKMQDLHSKEFRIGFKRNAFMNRLNMHVISNDFHSEFMRNISHWNNFNTELFITFQAVYVLMSIEGRIEPLSAESIQTFNRTIPVQCNKCTFKTGNFVKFKSHLEYHWNQRESLNKKQMSTLSGALKKVNLQANGSVNPDRIKKTPNHGQNLNNQSSTYSNIIPNHTVQTQPIQQSSDIVNNNSQQAAEKNKEMSYNQKPSKPKWYKKKNFKKTATNTN